MSYLRSLGLILLALSAAGCAHKGAVKVACDQHLEPINRPIAASEPPVSMQPESDTADRARQP